MTRFRPTLILSLLLLIGVVGALGAEVKTKVNTTAAEAGGQAAPAASAAKVPAGGGESTELPKKSKKSAASKGRKKKSGSAPLRSMPIINATLNELYKNNVNKDNTAVYHFSFRPGSLSRMSALRLYVSGPKSLPDHPLQITTRIRSEAYVRQLPMEVAVHNSNRTQNTTVVFVTYFNQTICTDLGSGGKLSKSHKKKNVTAVVEIATFNPMFTSFEMELYVQKDFVLKTNSEYAVSLGPMQPYVFRFPFPKGFDYALWSLTSADNNASICMTVSVLEDACPASADFVHAPRSLEARGRALTQTVRGAAGLTLSREQFPKGITLVLSVNYEDHACGGQAGKVGSGQNCALALALLHQTLMTEPNDRLKHVRFSFSGTLTAEEYHLAVNGIWTSIVMIYVVALIIFASLHYFKVTNADEARPANDAPAQVQPSGDSGDEVGSHSPLLRHEQTTGISNDNYGTGLETAGEEHFGRLRLHPADDDPLAPPGQGAVGGAAGTWANQSGEEDEKMMKQRMLGGDRTGGAFPKTTLTSEVETGTLVPYPYSTEDLRAEPQDRTAAPPPSSANRAQGREIPTTPATAIPGESASLVFIFSAGLFYAVPVGQMMHRQLRFTGSTGDNDLCYHNFLCAHQKYGMADFNHFFSNIGYCAFGLLFYLICLFRHRVKAPLCGRSVGLPSQTDFYHALAFALALEGVLSASYHICPTQENLQFDILFIYIIMIIITMKNYSVAHDHGLLRSTQTIFFSLASTLITTVAGMFFDSRAFTVVFAILLILASPVLSFKMYHLGPWQPVRVHKWDVHLPGQWKRARMPWANALLNAVVLILGLSLQESFTSLFFIVLSLNTLISTAWLYRRLLRGRVDVGDARTVLAGVFGVMALLGWAVALPSYFARAYDTQLTASQSRQLNTRCQLFHFYDLHDVWHLASAFASFCSFLVLLFLDDSLELVERKALVEAFGQPALQEEGPPRQQEGQGNDNPSGDAGVLA